MASRYRRAGEPGLSPPRLLGLALLCRGVARTYRGTMTSNAPPDAVPAREASPLPPAPASLAAAPLSSGAAGGPHRRRAPSASGATSVRSPSSPPSASSAARPLDPRRAPERRGGASAALGIGLLFLVAFVYALYATAWVEYERVEGLYDYGLRSLRAVPRQRPASPDGCAASGVSRSTARCGAASRPVAIATILGLTVLPLVGALASSVALLFAPHGCAEHRPADRARPGARRVGRARRRRRPHPQASRSSSGSRCCMLCSPARSWCPPRGPVRRAGPHRRHAARERRPRRRGRAHPHRTRPA